MLQYFNYDIEKILNHIAQFIHEMKRIDTFYSKFAWLINSYYISPKFCNILPKRQFSQNKIYAQFLKR